MPLAHPDKLHSLKLPTYRNSLFWFSVNNHIVAIIINNCIILLSSYRYTVVHRPGKSIFIEDALSRSPNLLSLSIFNNNSFPIILDDIFKEQRTDPILKQIISHLSSSTDPFPSFLAKLLGLATNNFTLENDVLYYLENISKFPSRRLKRLALPESSHEKIFNLHHDHSLAGHVGFERFWSSVCSEFWYLDFDHQKYCVIFFLFRI